MSVPDIFDRYLAEESQIELDVPAQDRARFHLVVRDCALSWKRHPKASFHILRGKHLFALQFQGPVEGKTVTLFTFRSAVETGEYRFHGIQLDKLPAGLTPQARSNLERIKELYEAALPGHMQQEGAIVIPVKKSPSIDFLPIVDEARRVVDDGQQEFEPIDESARLVIPAERAADLVAKTAPLPEPKTKPMKSVEAAAPAASAPAPKPAAPVSKPVSKPKKASKSRGPNVSVDDLILSRPIDPRATVVFDSNNWPKVVAPSAPKTVAKSPAKASAKASPEPEAKALSTSRLPQSAPTPSKPVDLSKWMNRPLKLVQTDEKPTPKPASAKGGKGTAKAAAPVKADAKGAKPAAAPAKVDPKAAKAAPAAAPAKGGKSEAKPAAAAKPAVPAKGAVKAAAPAKAEAKGAKPAAAPAKVDPKAAKTAKAAPAAAPAKGGKVEAKPAAAAKPAVPAKGAVKAAAPAKSEAKGAKPAAAPAKVDSKAAKAAPAKAAKAAKPAAKPKPAVKAAAKPAPKAAPAKAAKAAKPAAKPKPAAKAKPAAKSKKR